MRLDTASIRYTRTRRLGAKESGDDQLPEIVYFGAEYGLA